MAVYSDTATLCFHVDNHDSYLIRKLHKQTRERLHCDVTMRVGDDIVHAHSAVLGACSAYFDAMFSERWRKVDTYDLSHVFSSSNLLQSIIDYIYTGQITITEDSLDEILNAASVFLMADLKDLCAKYMVANLAVNNCLQMWLLSDTYSIGMAEPVCRAIAKNHFHHYLIYKSDTLSIPRQFLEKLIQEGVLDLLTSAQRTSFLRQWSQKNQCVAPAYPLKQSDGREQTPTEGRELTDSVPGGQESTDNVPGGQESADNVPGGQVSAENVSGVQESADTDPERPPAPLNRLVDTDCTTSRTSDALIGYVKRTKRNGSTEKLIDIYVYLGYTNSWLSLGEYPESWTFLEKGSLVGFAGTQAVFHGGINNQNMLVDLGSRTYKAILYPRYQPENTVSRRLFCFDSRLFLLWEEHTASSNDVTKRYVMILDEASMEWTKCADIDPGHVHIPPAASLSYRTVEQDALLYIWGQDHSSRTRGAYWMSFHKTGTLVTGYEVKVLSSPPVRTPDLRVVTSLSLRGWKHADMKLSGAQGRVHVYRTRTVKGDSQLFDVLLTYTAASDSWRRQENVKVELPKPPGLHLEMNTGNTRRKGTVQVDHTCDVQSYSCGNVYHVQHLVPFVSQLLVNNVTDGTWRQISPPPVDYPEMFFRFDVCHMPVEVASACGSFARYVDHSEGKGHSPLIHWDLQTDNSIGKLHLQSSNGVAIQECTYC